MKTPTSASPRHRRWGSTPTRSVFNALVGALSDHDFGVVQSAAESLSLLTGQNLGTDGGAWLDFAADKPNSLFQHQRLYTYTPYQEPPGRLDKIKFWDKPESATPQTPVGLNPAEKSDSGA